MKKISIIFSLMVVLAMVLAACAGGEENNESGALGTPGAESNNPSLEMTPESNNGVPGAITGTNEITATLPALSPTLAPATAPLTGTTGITSTTETTGTTGANILPVTGETGWAYLKNLLDAKVVDNKGDNLASVNDAIINLKSERVHYVVITTGGFLGIGEKALLVPWGAFAVQSKGEDGAMNSTTTGAVTGTLTSTTSLSGTAGTGFIGAEKVLVLNANKDDLKNAPDFDKNNLDFNMSDWNTSINSYWSSKITTPITDTTGLGASTMPSTTVTSTTTTTGTTVTGMNLTDWVYASDLVGMNIMGSGGENFGEIENAIVNEKSGKVDYVVLTAGDALNLDGKDILVPLKMFSRDTMDDHAMVFNGTMENLTGAPNFDQSNLPDVTLNNWDKAIKDWWNGLK